MIVWCDLETTGLDPGTDQIIEAGVAITDDDLNVKYMKQWVTQPTLDISLWAPEARRMHEENGLIEWLDNAKMPVYTLMQIEVEFIGIIDEYKAEGSPLAGNSIAFDRGFITAWLPRINNHLHYRHIDVSTVKELARRWYPSTKTETVKPHRVLADLQNSIDELRRYRKEIFR